MPAVATPCNRRWQSVRLAPCDRSHAAQIRNLHKQCWPAEHDEEEDDSLDGFLDRATFLHDADAVTWLLLWHERGPNRFAV